MTIIGIVVVAAVLFAYNFRLWGEVIDELPQCVMEGGPEDWIPALL